MPLVRMPLHAISLVCMMAIFAVGPSMTAANLQGAAAHAGPAACPDGGSTLLSVSDLVSLRGGLKFNWDETWVKVTFVSAVLVGFGLCVAGGLTGNIPMFVAGALLLGPSYVIARVRAGY